MRLSLVAVAFAAKISGGEACTAIAVDGHATTDGAAYAGMNADCSNCDPRMAYIPPAEHPEGSKRPLYIVAGTAPRFVGYGRGKFYEPKGDETHSPKMGEVPQVPKTFGYWEVTLPLMNEKGLTLGESSCGARLLNYPIGQAPAADPRTGGPATEGALDLSNMMEIALERCETALCGVTTMGALADEYGFFPMVGEWGIGYEPGNVKTFTDGGEAVTLADRTGEAWIFHVVGGVPGVVKSVWAAMRLPKGHVAFIANNFILRNVPLEPNDDWKFSPKIREAAKAAGLWTGVEPLDFARTFAADEVHVRNAIDVSPIPLYGSLRIWGLFGLASPTKYRNASLLVDPLAYPSTVLVEKKLKSTDVMGFLSDLYKGTEFDMTQGILAGPFGNPFPVEAGTRLGQIPRGISIARTVYSTIGQTSQRKEPVLWFATDTPAASVYVPFYAAAGGQSSPAYGVGTQLEFRRDSAYWAFDFVANYASRANWHDASENFIYPLQRQLHSEIMQEMPHVEARAKQEGPSVLGEWQAKVQQRVVDRWWRLSEELIVAYNDGFFNDKKASKLGLGRNYPDWWLQAVGFSQDVHPIFVSRNDAAVAPDYKPSSHSILPVNYNFAQEVWLYATPPSASDLAMAAGTSESSITFLVQVAFTSGVLLAGVGMGQILERRKQARRVGDSDSAYLRLIA
jgi:dipeptidase